MTIEYSIFSAGLWGAAVALLVSVALVLSKHIHGKYTLDTDEGVQKYHRAPTPRIGGLAIIAGFIAAGLFMQGEARTLWLWIGLAGVPALAFGLAEDITKKVRVKWRLLATIVSGLMFALVTGYTIDSVDMPGLDYLLGFSVLALAFTAFAVGGVANAVNLIDGFHGLAAGTLIIMLLAFAMVGGRIGDMVLVTVSLTMLLVVLGFFVVNFPHGKLFLGDAGAYFCGYVVAVLAVMLPARNPEVSPWVSLLILGYPVTETLVSIMRRLFKDGANPGEPDSDHLHHVVHRGWALAFTRNMQMPEAGNAMTSVFVWLMPVVTLLSVDVSDLRTGQALLLFLGCVVVYLGFYRITHVASVRLLES